MINKAEGVALIRSPVDCKKASHCKLLQHIVVLVWHGIPWESENCAETVERARLKWRKDRTGRQLQLRKTS